MTDLCKFIECVTFTLVKVWRQTPVLFVIIFWPHPNGGLIASIDVNKGNAWQTVLTINQESFGDIDPYLPLPAQNEILHFDI